MRRAAAYPLECPQWKPSAAVYAWRLPPSTKIAAEGWGGSQRTGQDGSYRPVPLPERTTAPLIPFLKQADASPFFIWRWPVRGAVRAVPGLEYWGAHAGGVTPPNLIRRAPPSTANTESPASALPRNAQATLAKAGLGR